MFPKQEKKMKMSLPGLTVHGNSYEILSLRGLLRSWDDDDWVCSQK
jgi:hypothetical protein